MSIFKDINMSNKRELKETYTNYRERLKKNYVRTKLFLKGEQVWDSKNKGTYIIVKSGVIK